MFAVNATENLVCVLTSPAEYDTLIDVCFSGCVWAALGCLASLQSDSARKVVVGIVFAMLRE